MCGPSEGRLKETEHGVRLFKKLKLGPRKDSKKGGLRPERCILAECSAMLSAFQEVLHAVLSSSG
jgi:hypothetical protein